MRLTGSRTYVRPPPVPKMPTGLVELMEDLTRDVLKNNPPDVYEFCAGHMRTLLEMRDGPFKPPLTLEQKIARAQEKVKTRGEARWQKYQEEKKKYDVNLKIESDTENKKSVDETKPEETSSPVVQPVLKPPVYPDLNMDNTSEIEISYKPNDVDNFSEKTDDKLHKNNIEKDDKANIANKEIPVVLKKSCDLPQDNISLNAEELDVLSDTKLKEDSDLKNGSVHDVTNIKIEIGDHQDSLGINEEVENMIIVNNEDLSKSTISKMAEPVNKSDTEIFVENSPEVKEDKSQRETDCQVSNSIVDIGKIVNSAVGVINVFNETSRSPSRDTEYIEEFNADGNSTELQVKNNNNLQTNVVVKGLSIETSNNNRTEADESIMKECNGNKESLETGQSERSVMSKEIQKPVVSENILIIQDSDKNVGNIIDTTEEQNNIEEKDDNLKSKHNVSEIIIEQEKMPQNVRNNLEPPLINVSDAVMLTVDVNHQNEINSKQNHDTQDFNAKGPLVNVVDIHETSDVGDSPNEGNIEIRISQVAEALNNEVPLCIDNDDVKKSVETMSPLIDTNNEVNPKIFNEIINNEAITCLEQADGHLISSYDDDPSDRKTDNTNETKSMSIDESTDGMDNTSLIESGTSEATDDISNHNTNASMDLETAAVTIQKVFRSFLFKSRASTFDDNDDNISLDEDNEKKDELEFQTTNNMTKERRGISRMDTVLQTVNEEKSLSLSTDDSSTLSSAATTIQAHVRGFLVRNKLHSNKTASTNSFVNSESHDDGDIEQKNNKTILNIHIVPEGGNYLSRDESILTSMDLSLDGSPPSSLNLHPLGYDKNERRKRLKREDAIQSISPPSNNSGKLSEDSVKDMLITENEQTDDQKDQKEDAAKNDNVHNRPGSGDTSPTNSLTIETVIEAHKLMDQESSDPDTGTPVKNTKPVLTKQSSDEMDVVTPYEDRNSLGDSRSTSKMMHSSEFHDIVLPTNVTRSDTSVVSEFKNVLAYFLVWNNS